MLNRGGVSEVTFQETKGVQEHGFCCGLSELSSSGMLHSIGWLTTNILGLLIGPICHLLGCCTA
jgi:hypothetical protein